MWPTWYLVRKATKCIKRTLTLNGGCVLEDLTSRLGEINSNMDNTSLLQSDSVIRLREYV